MKLFYLVLILALPVLSACANPALITLTSPQTTIPSSDKILLDELHHQVKSDSTMTQIENGVSIEILHQTSTFSFEDKHNAVLQFNVFEMPKNNQAIKDTTFRLMELGKIMAYKHNTTFSGIEVVYYLQSGEPWLAMAATPPWNFDQMLLTPLHPLYLEKLQQKGIIPLPSPPSYLKTS